MQGLGIDSSCNVVSIGSEAGFGSAPSSVGMCQTQTYTRGMPSSRLIQIRINRQHALGKPSGIIRAHCFKPAASDISTRRGNEVQYKTSSTDVAFIGLCRKAYGRIAGASEAYF